MPETPTPEGTTFAVCSTFTGDLGEEGADESLYYVSESKLEALVWMGKYVLFRAFGLIPYGDIQKMHAALDSAVNLQDISKGFNVAFLTYYVREVTPDELVDLNKISLPIQS